jgi:hypothetical protein
MSSNASDLSPFAGGVSKEKGHTTIKDTSLFNTNNDKSKSDKKKSKSKDPKKSAVSKSSFGGIALNIDVDAIVVPKEKKSLFSSKKKKAATPSIITESTANPSNTKSLVATPVANTENMLTSSIRSNPTTTSSETLATKDHGSKSAENAIASIKPKDKSKTHPSSISPFADKPKYMVKNDFEDISIFHKAYKQVETNTSIAQSSTQTSNEHSSGFQFQRVPKETDRATVLPESTNQCSKEAIQGAETYSLEVNSASQEESNIHLSPISKKEESQIIPQEASNSMNRSGIRRCVSPIPVTTAPPNHKVPTIANGNRGSKSNNVTSPTLSPKQTTSSMNTNCKNLSYLLSSSGDDVLGPFVQPSNSVLSDSVKRQSSTIIDLQPTDSLDNILWGGSSVVGSVSKFSNIDPVQSASSEAMDSVIWGSIRSSSLKERIPSTLGFFEKPDRVMYRERPQGKSKTMPSSISPHDDAHYSIEQGQLGGGEVRDEVCLDDIRFIRSASSELRFGVDKYEVP